MSTSFAVLMAFTHLLQHHKAALKLEEKLRKALVENQMSEDLASSFVAEMSPAGSGQVANDFARTKLIIIDEAKGTEEVYDFDKEFERDPDKADKLLVELAGGQPQMLEYLRQYSHQGGFLMGAQILIDQYYGRSPLDPEDSGIELVKGQGQSSKTFIKHKDGSIGFQEQFSITELKWGQEQSYQPSGPIAVVTSKSTLRMKKGEFEHKMGDIKIEAKDPAAKKIFAQPNNPFSRLMSWLKEKLSSMPKNVPENLKSIPDIKNKL